MDGFVYADPTRISWARALTHDLSKDRSYAFESECIRTSLYRPFTKQWLYFNRCLNEMVYQMPRLCPEKTAINLGVLPRYHGHFS
ncbi:type ISP restriction/modification enzyme [Thermomonas sp.]|uniref:type ISP restriction/modification enzyme n=1 Tax=Thermomonas sp. TaxID=1971895 RepID=UPI0035AE276A